MNIKYLILLWNANKKLFLLPFSYFTTNFLFILSLLMSSLLVNYIDIGLFVTR